MIYLDNAATSYPKPRGMLEKMNHCISNYCGNPGRSGHWMSIKTGEEIYHARKAVSSLFGIRDTNRLLFLSNATDALNLGLKGFLRPGDHVVTTMMEHNSVLRPLKAMEAYGIRHTIVPCNEKGFVDLDQLQASIDEKTVLIACTHASNVTGTIQPIGAIGSIAQERGIRFLVDASQTAGSIPIDVERNHIDLMAGPGHKSLLGPQGTGFLYVSPAIELEPLKEGGTGTYSKDLVQPKDFPEGFEAGTLNAPGIIALGQSVLYIKSQGVEKIRDYEQFLNKQLSEGLRNMKHIKVYGPVDEMVKSGITLFSVDHMDCEDVSDQLDRRYQIASRAGFHCAPLAHEAIGTGDTGAVRLSVGPFNTITEIKKTIEAVFRISQ